MAALIEGGIVAVAVTLLAGALSHKPAPEPVAITLADDPPPEKKEEPKPEPPLPVPQPRLKTPVKPAEHKPQPAPEAEAPPPVRARRFSVPFDPPVSLVNGLSLRAFNALYYAAAPRRPRRQVVDYRPFFQPLDRIGQWNRLYGPRGFLQHQCVLPPASEEAATAEILDRIASSGQGSFLAVLKPFGARVAPGLLSFPRPGTTLALDFPFRGRATLELLDALDGVVMAAGGAVYPAKDARMAPATFAASFPRLAEFRGHVDPGFSSAFWRRVAGVEG